MNLGNVIASSYKADQRTTFVSLEDHEILKKWRVPSFEIQVCGLLRSHYETRVHI